MKLMQLLMGLDNSYMQIRSSILSRDHFLDVRSAYATISSEESHMIVTTSRSSRTFQSSSSAFSAEQMATLISLIKDNSINEKGVHVNMAGDVEKVGDLSLEAMEDDEVALVDGVFEGAFGALGDESWCFGKGVLVSS
ncbi:hypothetical protein Tco_0532055 [Tanacetum coccineum]